MEIFIITGEICQVPLLSILYDPNLCGSKTSYQKIHLESVELYGNYNYAISL